LLVSSVPDAQCETGIAQGRHLEGGWRGLWTLRIAKSKNFALSASSNGSL